MGDHVGILGVVLLSLFVGFGLAREAWACMGFILYFVLALYFAKHCVV